MNPMEQAFLQQMAQYNCIGCGDSPYTLKSRHRRLQRLISPQRYSWNAASTHGRICNPQPQLRGTNASEDLLCHVRG